MSGFKKKKNPYQEKMLATNEHLLMVLIRGKSTNHKIKLESNINMLKPVR